MPQLKTTYMIALIFCIFSFSFGARLTGTAKDSTQTPMSGVKIVLTGLSNPGFSDSSLSGADGFFSFNDIPIGSYRLALSCPGFFKNSSEILVGNGTSIFNMILVHIPAGTTHSGIVTGVWLPSGNPHIIIDTAYIKDSLIINPGCEVTLVKPIFVHGKFSIGSSTGNTTTIKNGQIICDDTNARLSLANVNVPANLNLLAGITKCRNLSLDSTSSLYLSNNVTIYVMDSLTIARMAFYKDPNVTVAYPGYVLKLVARNMTINHSFFDGLRLDFSCDSTLIIDYSILFNKTYEGATISRGYEPSFSKTFISHSNFIMIQFNYINLDSAKIINSIFSNCNFVEVPGNTKYQSTFSYNIFSLSSPGADIFGIFRNIQLNANGDSCDLWFNLKGTSKNSI